MKVREAAVHKKPSSVVRAQQRASAVVCSARASQSRWLPRMRTPDRRQSSTGASRHGSPDAMAPRRRRRQGNDGRRTEHRFGLSARGVTLLLVLLLTVAFWALLAVSVLAHT